MKERYIRRVKRQLCVSRRERAEIVRDLEEIFSSAAEHGETQMQVIERLGAPKAFADNAAAQFGVNNRKKRRMTRGVAATAVAAILLIAMLLWSPVLFQQGNPIPYLVAAGKITQETPYVQVNVDGGSSVYISKRGECPELFEYVETSRNVTWAAQAGSGYIFSNGVDTLVVSAEIYLGKYTVWQVSNKTLASN